MKLFTVKGFEVGVDSVNINSEEKLISPAFTASYKEKTVTISVAMWHFKAGLYIKKVPV